MDTEKGWSWLVFGGVAAVAFYLLFRKTAPTATEVFRRQQERPRLPEDVAGHRSKVGTGEMAPSDMIPKNASYAGRGDEPQAISPPSTGGMVPNPFKENPNQDGLPPGFSGSFDDDPEAADLDGTEGEEGDVDGQEEPS